MLKSIALVALIIPGVVYTTHKEWQRLGFWNFSDEESKQYIDNLGKQMVDMPDVMGDWKYIGDSNVNPDQIRVAKITKYQARVYENKKTGTQVSIFLSTGPRGDICIHTPAQCLPNTGNAAIAEEEVRQVRQVDEEGKEKSLLGSFVFQRYRNKDNQETEIWWSFNESGKWEGTKNPRMSFTKPGLYKLYVNVEKMGTALERNSDPPQASFLRVFIPELNKRLFPTEQRPAEKVAAK